MQDLSQGGTVLETHLLLESALNSPDVNSEWQDERVSLELFVAVVVPDLEPDGVELLVVLVQVAVIESVVLFTLEVEENLSGIVLVFDAGRLFEVISEEFLLGEVSGDLGLPVVDLDSEREVVGVLVEVGVEEDSEE